jgi:hypothetical protein
MIGRSDLTNEKRIKSAMRKLSYFEIKRLQRWIREESQQALIRKRRIDRVRKKDALRKKQGLTIDDYKSIHN